MKRMLENGVAYIAKEYGGQYKHGEDKEGRIDKQEQHEISIVALSDTLIQPNAVMVKARDAEAAHAAVFASGWLDGRAGRAGHAFREH
jgi:hypothetical protein